MRKTIAVFLFFVTPALAQDRTAFPLSYISPQAEQDMAAEYARHPGQHFVCTTMDRYCVTGHWEEDPTPGEIAAEIETATRMKLEAMKKADLQGLKDMTISPSQTYIPDPMSPAHPYH